MKDAHKLVEQEIESTEIYKGELLHVFKDRARLPDGATSTREWIKHQGASAILPVCSNGDVILLKQFRYPVRQVFWEVPAGKIDPGETPDSTALREVQEEAGVKCHCFDYVGYYNPCIGYSDEIIHLYIGWDLEELDQNVDEDEFLLVERLPFHEAVQMGYDGHLPDGKTFTTVMRAWHWWQQHEPFPVG